MAGWPGELLPFCGVRGKLALVFAVLVALHAADAFKFENDELDTDRIKRGAAAMIVGGVDVKHGERPYLVYVQTEINGEPFVCGGAAVARRWILTAAHCLPPVNARNVNSIEVRAGSIHRHRIVDRYRVQSVFIHPDFYSATYGGKTFVTRNDVALLYLDRELSLKNSKGIKLIRLNEDPDCPMHNAKCTIAGWGKPHNDSKNVMDRAQEVTVGVVGHKQCSKILSPINTVGLPWTVKETIYSDAHICAGSSSSAHCGGDSGGPMVCTCNRNGKPQRVHAGIVSFSLACSKTGAPGVLARTSTYVPWIKRCIKSRGTDCPNHVLVQFPDHFVYTEMRKNVQLPFHG